MFSETDRLFLKTTFERGRYTISHQFNFSRSDNRKNEAVLYHWF